MLGSVTNLHSPSSPFVSLSFGSVSRGLLAAGCERLEMRPEERFSLRLRIARSRFCSLLGIRLPSRNHGVCEGLAKREWPGPRMRDGNVGMAPPCMSPARARSGVLCVGALIRVESLDGSASSLGRVQMALRRLTDRFGVDE